ncbi:MAG: hypothetical protein A3K19_11500 [Lentisphaerae bacterium RIFOXYB12_FULL_65_16]|nr:MAG: hypothetical protein A3K18_27570 [Lentisphaerae bacterium RIFOXYA12_64_32]OGV88243.1 MAG: hypothetical protein A3K19_11500 [Lentisphaerae bacterium RIFOXYB12_FULL_65_16]
MSGDFFIRDLAVVMIVAGAAAYVCRRCGLSVVTGYLVAGAAIGPHTPLFALVADSERVQTLAQIGLVFIIFFMGLNLNINRLRRLGFAVVIAGVIEAILILNGCRLVGLALDWNMPRTLFLAGMLMISSSAIVSKVLDELNLAHERPGQMALGMAVVEDAVVVVMLTLLTSVVQFGMGGHPALLPTVSAMGAFVVFVVLISLLIVPNLLTHLSRSAGPEVRALLVAGLLLALGWLAVRMGYSMALGAFLLGAIIGSTRQKSEVEEVFWGVREIFGAVFFVAMGMLADFHLLVSVWPLLILVTVLALVLRPLACSAGLIAVGSPAGDAIHAGLALTPLGEFSFIIAQIGVEGGVLPPSFFPVAVGASLLTSVLAPVLTRRAEHVSRRVVGATPVVVRKWGAFYQDWLARLLRRQDASVLWRLTRKRLLQVGVLMLFSSAAVLLANPVYGRVMALVGRDWLFPHGLPILFWSVFGVVLLAPLIALWRNVEALAMILADSATMGARQQAQLRPLLEVALRTVGGVVLGAWLLALLPSALSILGVLLVVGLVLGGVAVAFWPRLVRLQSRLEIEFGEQLKRASQATSASAWSLALPGPSSDWELDIDEVALSLDTDHAGKTLDQLAVRRRYGCSVVGIDRQGFGIINPGAGIVLYPRDKLLLLGTGQQLATAARELGGPGAPASERTGFDELTMETVTVPAESPLGDRPLKELDLVRRAGVQIGGIRRGTERLLSLSGDERLLAGDELLVLGTHRQIEAFRALLVPAAHADPPPS